MRRMSLEFLSLNGDPRVFCFDMEWLGCLTTNLHDTRIYSIAAVHCATQKQFSVVVDPAVSWRRLKSYHTFAGCRKVTKSWLKRNGAVPLTQAFARFVEFVNECGNACRPPGMPVVTEQKGGFSAVLVAHGCHRADLPVLKSALRRCAIPYQTYWRFFDSLLFFRRVLRPIRQDGTEGYTLSAVARTLGVRPAEAGKRHDALPDALTLFETISKYPRIYGALYTWWQTPLTIIPGVGLQTQTQLIQRARLLCAEDLLNFAQKAKGNAKTRAEAVHNIAAALFHMGMSRTAPTIAAWCVSGLGVFDEISWEYKVPQTTPLRSEQ